jgi:hypothetical protein
LGTIVEVRTEPITLHLEACETWTAVVWGVTCLLMFMVVNGGKGYLVESLPPYK